MLSRKRLRRLNRGDGTGLQKDTFKLTARQVCPRRQDTRLGKEALEGRSLLGANHSCREWGGIIGAGDRLDGIGREKSRGGTDISRVGLVDATLGKHEKKHHHHTGAGVGRLGARADGVVEALELRRERVFLRLELLDALLEFRVDRLERVEVLLAALSAVLCRDFVLDLAAQALELALLLLAERAVLGNANALCLEHDTFLLGQRLQKGAGAGARGGRGGWCWCTKRLCRLRVLKLDALAAFCRYHERRRPKGGGRGAEGIETTTPRKARGGTKRRKEMQQNERAECEEASRREERERPQLQQSAE
eukprot:m.114206 g.114206  ORF g.114206 m.114206 type:complete len:307 (-) comp9441_c0_seq3:175-1095(-)